MTLASEQAEQALVGRLLLDPKQIPLVAGSLKPDDFGVGTYGDVYGGMLRLQAEGRPVDLVTLRTVLDSEVDIDPLEITAGHRGPVEEYAGIIRAASQRRTMIAELDYVRDLVASGEGDPVSALERAVAKILDRSDADVVDPGSTSMAYLETLSQRQRGEDPGMTYGVPGMDDILLPARRGRLILLAARPSVGKTAMAETIADHWAAQGRGPVLFVSLEMDREELLDRAMARDTGVSADRIARGHLDPKSLELVMDAAAKRGAGAIHYMDEGSITTARIRAAGARTKMKHDGALAGVIVDYTQLLEDRVDGNDNSRVAAISRALKQMAKGLRCPVLAMSQLNRTIEYERKRRPRLSDLRDSGALEQDADVVMVLTGTPGESQRTVHVLKQRQGKVGEFHVDFDGSHMRWLEPALRSSLMDDDDAAGVWGRLSQPETAEPSRW